MFWKINYRLHDCKTKKKQNKKEKMKKKKKRWRKKWCINFIGLIILWPLFHFHYMRSFTSVVCTSHHITSTIGNLLLILALKQQRCFNSDAHYFLLSIHSNCNRLMNTCPNNRKKRKIKKKTKKSNEHFSTWGKKEKKK